MIKIFSVSRLSSLPAQAVSTIRFNIFKRIDPKQIEYWADVENKDRAVGSIHALHVSKNKFLRYVQRFFWMHLSRPDVILFTGEVLELPFYFLRPRSARVVLHLNGPMPENPWRYPYRTLSFICLWYSVIFLAKRAFSIIAITEHVKRTLDPFSVSCPIFVIYNGVDIEIFHPKSEHREYLHNKFKIDFTKPIILFAGSLIQRKRPDVVLNIAVKRSEYHFLFVGGKGNDADFTIAMKERNNVQWIPYMDRKDIALLFASVDVFCFPSLYEGFGMVVAEAMASGCPVVVTGGSGPAEFIAHNESGMVVEHKNSEIDEFLVCIDSLLSNYGLRKHIQEKARERAERSFAWDILSSQWKEALVQIVSKQK